MTFFFSSKKNETVPNFTSILDYMKYKKIIELLPAYTLFIFLLSSNSACSNGQASNKQTEDTVTDTITTFVYPEVPTMLNTPELRADYLARHYWKHVNFADTNYIHHPEVTEQAWVNFIDILQLVPAQTRDIALKTLFTQAEKEKKCYTYLTSLADKYLYDPNSPMRNEELYISVLDAMLQSPVMDNTEKLFQTIFKEVKGYDIKLPLMRMKYDDAIDKYGSDKPDLRFSMPIIDITDVFRDTDIVFLKKVIDEDGIINCLVVKDKASDYSRKMIDKLTDYVKTYKASGLAYLKYNDELTGSLKGLSIEESNELINKLELENNDLVLIVSGKKDIVKTSLGSLRCKLGKELGLIKNDEYKLLWVTDFPVFEYSELEGRFLACHHPFTAPKDSDVDKLLTDKANCYAKAYDIVINGYEAGGGSIRIHDKEIQKIMFEALGFSDEEAYKRFGFFIDAFKYGTPPHGGFALGLDRLTMLLTNTDNIRDVIAFPKTASASCLMSEAPNVVDKKQLDDLGIELISKK